MPKLVDKHRGFFLNTFENLDGTIIWCDKKAFKNGGFVSEFVENFHCGHFASFWSNLKLSKVLKVAQGYLLFFSYKFQ